MPFVTLGLPNHDVLPGVSANDHHTATVAGDLNHQDLANRAATDHHTATVAGDLNLADMAERLHASLTSVAATDHRGAATQAEMESEANSANVVRGSTVRFSPGVAKGWAVIAADGTLTASYNVASITDTGIGDRTVVWDDDFSSADYAISNSTMEPTVVAHMIASGNAQVGSVQVTIFDAEGNTAADERHHIIAFGDQ